MVLCISKKGTTRWPDSFIGNACLQSAQSFVSVITIFSVLHSLNIGRITSDAILVTTSISCAEAAIAGCRRSYGWLDFTDEDDTGSIVAYGADRQFIP